MKLITSAIQKKLEKNFQHTCETGVTGKVVLKLFGGNCTWLITEIEPDNDIMWCLADIGLGCCEYGTVRLSEIKATKFPPFGLPVERDQNFKGGTVSEFTAYYNEHNTLNGC